MAVYVDLRSLGPTKRIAGVRRQILRLEGKEIWDERTIFLRSLRAGDVIQCRPSALPFWRGAPFGVIVQVIEEPIYEDSLRFRYNNWLIWALVQEGVQNGEARQVAAHPPKTAKSRYWEAFQRARLLAARIPIVEHGESDPQTPTYEREPEPYTWSLTTPDDPAFTIPFRNALATLEPIGLDVETDIADASPNEMKDTLVGLAIVIGDEGFYFRREHLSSLWPFLTEARIVGANLKYDLAIMTRASLEDNYPLSFSKENVAGDSMVAAHLLCLPTGGLKKLVKSEYDHDMITYTDVTQGGRIRISEADQSLTARYCCGDAWWAKRLENDLARRLENSKAYKLYREVDLPLIPTLVRMEMRGFGFDRGRAKSELLRTSAEIEALEKVIGEMAVESGFNLPPERTVCKGCRNGKNKKLDCDLCAGAGEFFSETHIKPGSDQQIGAWLFGHLNLPMQRITHQTRRPSTDKLSLLRVQHLHPAVSLLLTHKKLSKYHGYLESWLAESERDGRLHSVFSNATVVSGRLSSKDPNLQQVSERWRSLFTASEGCSLLAADQSQFEVRIAAFQSRDPKLLAIVNAEPGTFEGDLHAQTMYHVFNIPFARQTEHKNIRIVAKTYNFAGLFYGASAPTLVEQIEKAALEEPDLHITVPTISEAAKNLAGVRELYHVYSREYVPVTIARARDCGNCFYTAFRRPRIISYLTSGYKEEREAAEREGINHTIQGTAADLIRMAMNLAIDLPHGWLLGQNHDELIFDVDTNWTMWYKEHVKVVMELGQPLGGVPLVIDFRYGPTWAKE